MKERPNKDRDQRKPQQPPDKGAPPKRDDRQGWDGDKPMEGDKRNPGRGIDPDKNTPFEKRQGEDKQYDPKKGNE